MAGEFFVARKTSKSNLEVLGMKAIKATRKLTTMGLLAAVSVILVYLVHFPILPGAAFLEYDPADIPIFIGTFLFGPFAGLLLTVVVSVVQGLTVSAQSGVIGILMHIFATGAFALVAGLIYRRSRTRKSAMLALLAGVLVMTATMCVWNIIFTPIFSGMPRQAVIAMLPTAIIPFNLIKSGVNALVTMVLYKKISLFVFREKAEEHKFSESSAGL